jgi:hypothetical protein
MAVWLFNCDRESGLLMAKKSYVKIRRRKWTFARATRYHGVWLAHRLVVRLGVFWVARRIFVGHMMRAIRMGKCNNPIVVFLVTLLGMSVLIGCDDGKIARYPVTGTVLVDGKPAEGATVIFVPVDGTEEFQRERPFDDSTDSEGRFELRTFQPGDGAPAGEYKVMVRWLATAGPTNAETDRDRPVGGPPDRLRGRYFNPETSGLSAKVEESATEVPPLDLKSR